MTLAELGAQFREERIALGLMVEDVAARLKIPSRILRTIEEGGVSDLPHTVYTRGFIKGYGLILGHSHEKITALLDSLEDFDDDFSPPKTLEALPLRAEDRSSHTRNGLGLALKVVLVLLLLGGAYWYYSKTFQSGEGPVPLPVFQRSVAERPAPAAQGSALTSGVELPEASNGTSNDASDGTSGESSRQASGGVSVVEVPSLPEQPQQIEPGVDAESMPNATLLESAVAIVESVPAGEGSSEQASLTEESEIVATEDPAVAASRIQVDPLPEGTVIPLAETEQVPVGDAAPLARPRGSSESASVFGTAASPTQLPSGMQRVVLTATATCWVHSNADGTVTREFSMAQGESFALTFTDSLELKLGNAGGVTITYNGATMPAPGESGQVRTLRFPPN